MLSTRFFPMSSLLKYQKIQKAVPPHLHKKQPIPFPKLSNAVPRVRYSPRSLYFATPKGSQTITFTSKRYFSTKVQESLALVKEHGAYKVSIPLPSNERCLFALRGDQTVKSFLDDLKREDASIQNVSLYAKDGSRIAQGASIDSIFPSGVELAINSKRYSISGTSGSAIGNQLVYLTSESNSPAEQQEISKLRDEILPLLKQKQVLDAKASRMAHFKVYGGLILLCAQWAVLARLTWWEFNWDIMEPVTYFITFGTGVIGYTYFALSKREFTYPDLRESWLAKSMRREYQKAGFNTERYFQLEYELNRLDPDALEALKEDLEKAKALEAPKAS